MCSFKASSSSIQREVVPIAYMKMVLLNETNVSENLFLTACWLDLRLLQFNVCSIDYKFNNTMLKNGAVIELAFSQPFE